MAEHFEHHGVRYSVELTKLKHGKWGWSYQIEDGRHGKLSDRSLADRNIALAEAKLEAEFRIDST